MGFLDDVKLPGQTSGIAPSAKPSGFLGSVSLPQDAAKAARDAAVAKTAEESKREAEAANTPGAIFKQTLSNVGGFFADTYKNAKDALLTPPTPKANLLQEPYAPLEAGYQNLHDTIQNSADRLTHAVETIKDSHATALQKGVAAGEAGLGALNGLFTIVTAPLAAVSKIPVIGYVADGVNNLFGAIGSVGADAAGAPLDALPISAQAKEQLRPLVRELGALAGQVVAGKAGGEAFKTISDKSKQVLGVVQEDIRRNVPVVSETPGETVIDVNTPTKRLAEYSRSQGYEPYVPDSQLPSIQVGPKAESGLPVIRADAPAPKKVGDITFEPIKPEPAPKALETVPVEEPVPTPRAVPKLREVKGTGETKSRGLAEGIEAKAIENRLTDTFGDLPEYRTLDLADQAQKAADLVSTDYATARDVALGRKAPPRDLHPESVLVAVERKAIADGDVATLRELATNSRLTYEATTMGQRIRILGEREPTSPVGAIKVVQDARTEALKAKGVDAPKQTEAIISEAKAEVAKAVSEGIKRPTWDQFIQEITCGY